MNFQLTENNSGEVSFFVKAEPNKKVNEVKGFSEYLGHIVLQISVQEPPVDQRANRAVEVCIANFFCLSKSQVFVLKGHTSKLKIICCNCSKDHIIFTLKNRGWIIP